MYSKKYITFAVANAQMAELVDALVSNTSGFISMPVRSRLWVQRKIYLFVILFFLPINKSFFVQNNDYPTATYILHQHNLRYDNISLVNLYFFRIATTKRCFYYLCNHYYQQKLHHIIRNLLL